MILVDTSAWVEFLRDTGSVVCSRVGELLDEAIATSHVRWPPRSGGWLHVR